jgi:N-methylhydantoinase A
MRYYRQGYELPVTHDDPAADPDLPSTLAGRFVEAHRRFYQFDLEVEPELVVVRCVATGVKPRPEVREHGEATGPVEDAVADPEHRIYWKGSWTAAPVYARGLLQPGHELIGPVVVEQEDSTTLIHPGSRARVDRFLNLVLERL